MRDAKSGKIYLIEINARQPASTTLESRLQREAGNGMTVFAAHVAALRGEKAGKDLQAIEDGAQIVQRVTRSRTRDTAKADLPALEKLGVSVIRYDNQELNKDLIRVTSSKGIMKSPDELNSLGKEIASYIS
jgi:hypothetical protein